MFHFRNKRYIFVARLDFRAKVNKRLPDVETETPASRPSSVERDKSLQPLANSGGYVEESYHYFVLMPSRSPGNSRASIVPHPKTCAVGLLTSFYRD